MRIYILSEKFAEKGFNSEHGLSYLIEIDGKKVLFDTGQSNVFLRNAAKLGLDVQREVNTVVLSHGHWDHGNGLRHLKGMKLITHPGSFRTRFRKKDHTPIGLSQNRLQITKKFELHESNGPFRISDNLLFLGKIPRKNNFEGREIAFELGNGAHDPVPDDSALVALCENGLVVISGCAHSGICNICEYAKALTGIRKLNAVIGGVHLKSLDEQALQTIKYFEMNRLKKLMPSHCTGIPVLSLFNKHFDSERVRSGQVFAF